MTTKIPTTTLINAAVAHLNAAGPVGDLYGFVSKQQPDWTYLADEREMATLGRALVHQNTDAYSRWVTDETRRRVAPKDVVDRWTPTCTLDTLADSAEIGGDYHIVLAIQCMRPEIEAELDAMGDADDEVDDVEEV